MNEILKKEILYRSIHRGCKETDHLIGEFAKAHLDSFNDEQAKLFKNLIEEDDLLIYDWILNKQEVLPKYIGLIQQIQQFHKII